MRINGGGVGLDEVDYIDIEYNDVRIYLEDGKVRCKDVNGEEYTLAWYIDVDDFWRGFYLARIAAQMILDAYSNGEKVFRMPLEGDVIEYAKENDWGPIHDD